MPQSVIYHISSVCADTHMFIRHDVPFLHQEEPCQGVVSTSWCTSDGAGCDVGSSNWSSQDAARSHTMGALNYPVRHLNRQTGTSSKPASQPESQPATKGHETLRTHVYAKQANGLTAHRGPWKPCGHNHGESWAGLGRTESQDFVVTKERKGGGRGEGIMVSSFGTGVLEM